MKAVLLVAAALAALASSPASSGQTACPAHFAGGTAPDVKRPSLAKSARELCFEGFAVLHSGLSRTPLWVAQRLDRDRVRSAREMERVNDFHADTRLPVSERAELSDYARSGFDRGHMAPSGDMPDAAGQRESFTLANMIPQDPDNNRRLWAGVESAVRDLAVREGEVFVITGPLFQGSTVKSLKGRVAVPTDVFKAVYFPRKGIAAAYLAPNDSSLAYKVVALSELEWLVGFDLFPGLPANVKGYRAKLPEPKVRDGGTAGKPSTDGGFASSFAGRMLKGMWGAIR